MTVIILSGPPASGKNTVADQLSRRLGSTAVVDTDVLRQMVGVDLDHADLTVRNACSLATNAAEAGLDVVIVDVLTNETAQTYRRCLGDVHVALLMPTEDEINRRLLSHPHYLSRGDIGVLYQRQLEFTAYDERIDNTATGAAETAEHILAGLGAKA